MRTKKRNDSGKVNDKYVNLLVQTFEKYKDISTLGGRVEEIEQEEKEETTVNVYNNAKYVQNKLKGTSDSNLDDKAKKKRAYTNHQLYKIKLFTPDEDEVIVQAMKFADKKSAAILELSKVLNRTYKSVQGRILKLETGSSNRRVRVFSLEEDCLIIDNSLRSLSQCKSLEEAQLENIEELAKDFGRHEKSVLDRWNAYLKVWLLQYYQKTMNLEIRPMLCSVLAENFDSFHDIDWHWVKKIPEFSGYTPISLKRVFFNKIIVQMARKLNINRTEMTLQTVAQIAKDFKFSSVSSNNVIDRQKQIIDYFEKKVQVERIEFVELNVS